MRIVLMHRSTRLVFITRDLTRTAVETSLRQVLGLEATKDGTRNAVLADPTVGVDP